MSSTSPLSPKHLAGSVPLQEQAESDATAQAVAGYLGKTGGHRRLSGATYCVNFHVVGLPSAASTMIPDSGTRAVGSGEGDQKLIQWRAAAWTAGVELAVV
jgi:hypothetical protein